MEATQLNHKIQSDDMRAFAIMNMNEQVHDLSSNRSNVLAMYDSSYNMLYTYADGDVQSITALNESRDKFYMDTYSAIHRRYGIIIDTENVESESFAGLVKILYELFVFNYRDVVVKFIENYIIKNKKTIYTQIPNEMKSKDIIVSACKNIFKDNRDAVIVASIHYIIDQFIVNNDMEIDYFMNTLALSSDINVSLLTRSYDRGIVDFSPKFYKLFVKAISNGEAPGVEAMVKNDLVQFFPRKDEFSIVED